MCKLTAALFEDDCAAEFVEPLGVETRPVNGDGVLRWTRGSKFKIVTTVLLQLSTMYVIIFHKKLRKLLTPSWMRDFQECSSFLISLPEKTLNFN